MKALNNLVRILHNPSLHIQTKASVLHEGLVRCRMNAASGWVWQLSSRDHAMIASSSALSGPYLRTLSIEELLIKMKTDPLAVWPLQIF